MSRKQTVTYPYPPCAITERYPILQRIPPEERATWVSQAERGEELTNEQSVRLGFASSIKGGVLVPCDGSLTKAQLNFAFPLENRRVLAEIVALGMEAARKAS